MPQGFCCPAKMGFECVAVYQLLFKSPKTFQNFSIAITSDGFGFS